MSIETVVLAVDSEDTELTERLATTTGDIAQPADATVALAHLYTEAEYRETRARLNFDPDSEVTPDVLAERNVRVREFADALATTDLDVTAHGRICDDASKGERLTDLAEEIDADLLVVGERGRSPAGKAIFGSTAQEVMLNAPCPVTFVRGA